MKTVNPSKQLDRARANQALRLKRAALRSRARHSGDALKRKINSLAFVRGMLIPYPHLLVHGTS